MRAERQPFRRTPEGVVVACRLTPRGGRDSLDSIAELADGTVVVLARVRCAPHGGKANEALCALMADELGAPRSRARIVAGAKSRLKQVEISGDPDALASKLESLPLERS